MFILKVVLLADRKNKAYITSQIRWLKQLMNVPFFTFIVKQKYVHSIFHFILVHRDLNLIQNIKSNKKVSTYKVLQYFMQPFGIYDVVKKINILKLQRFQLFLSFPLNFKA